MDAIPAVPPAGSGLDAVAEIARRRADGWSEFAYLFTAPTAGWVRDLRGGEARRRLEVAIGWRAGELEQFTAPMLMFGAFERSSRRRTLEADLEKLTVAHTSMAAADVLGLASGASELLARLASDESTAWAAAALPRARDLRLQQSRELRSEAGEALVRACEEIANSRPRQPFLALGQMCRLWVDGEQAGSEFAGS